MRNNLIKLQNKICELKTLNTKEANHIEYENRLKAIRELERIYKSYNSLIKKDMPPEHFNLLRDTLDLACKIITEPNKVTFKEITDYQPKLQEIARIAKEENWEKTKSQLFYGTGAAASIILGVAIGVVVAYFVAIGCGPIGLTLFGMYFFVLPAGGTPLLLSLPFTGFFLYNLCQSIPSNHGNINRFFDSVTPPDTKNINRFFASATEEQITDDNKNLEDNYEPLLEEGNEQRSSQEEDDQPLLKTDSEQSSSEEDNGQPAVQEQYPDQQFKYF